MTYTSPIWRFGPIHYTAGDVLLGDPMGHHAVLSASGVCGVQLNQFDEFLPWGSISSIDFSCDSTRYRLVSRALDALTLVLTATSGDGTPFDAHDPSSLRVTTATGEEHTWQIDSMETGKYWRPEVDAVAVFLEMMRRKPSFRAITEDPTELRSWLSDAVSHSQRNAQTPADPTSDSQS